MLSACFILCIDDDEDDRELVCTALKEIDPSIQLIHATNGLDALKYLQHAKATSQLPKLILLDVNMPKMNGKETLVKIQEDEKLRGIPLVIFTTSSRSEDKAYFAKQGVEMLSKPTRYDELQREMYRLVEHCND